MKKRAALMTVFALITTPVFAAQQGGGFVDPAAPAEAKQAPAAKGGFVNGENSVVTVKQATAMDDDSWVTLRGNIEKQVGDDDYIFRDSTGTLRVDISDKRWGGVTVSPSDRVEITGELDKDFNSTEVEVKQIRKLP